MTQDVAEDFADPGFRADPHPRYAQWRAAGPVRRTRLPGGGAEVWLITRYEDARRALSDPRLSKQRAETGTVRSAARPGERNVFGQHMLAFDPPHHTRLRRLVSAAFTARRIEALRPRIEQITTELLDAVAGRDEVDLIDAFAFPLPIQVICELLGVPVADRDAFRAWSDVLVTGDRPRMPEALKALGAYIRGLLARRRADPGDDLLSGLIQVRDEGDRLSEDELSSMVFLLLIAGHETTVNLLGNGVYLLLKERPRWERLRAEPELLPTAIEEFLRFEGPVATATFRVATEDLEIGGQTIAAGDPVMVGLLSAGHDEERFPEAEELRLDRAQNPHLAFGHGVHYCLGAPLARLEAQVAFGQLLSRFPRLALAVPADALAWRPGALIRGLVDLPVRLS
ncbi:cytochrome P450 family protein [Symbioplanes lichenis]|uniref:cytochrome P450 family protein n=1 Tax=Symbioplanes lichenis TaxID=1629072 RepID=UPI002738487A|nr:cytochrome P450 [Actinoplanes lichenis]